MAEKNKNHQWRVLCIDDSRLNRAVIIKTLSEINLEVDEAEDGLQGLDLLRKNKYDLILLDIIMPNLDGFGFLSSFKNITGDLFIPVILMTGSDDLNSKIKGLSIGADDYLIKPLNEKELLARVLSLLRLKSTHDELFEKNELIKKELDAAKKVQEYIIPSDFSDIMYPSISGRYIPIEDIGGDFFDIYRFDDGRQGYLMADVTGHGIPAALVMTMSKMLCSVYSRETNSTTELLARVNREIRNILIDSQYITAFYVIYDPEQNIIRFSNAGHTRALFYRKAKNRVLALDTDGLFLGISDVTFYEEKSLKIENGDRLFLYTDGLSEIKDNGRQEFGEARIASFIRENNDLNGDSFAETLLQKIDQFSSLKERDDDIAFLSIAF